MPADMQREPPSTESLQVGFFGRLSIALRCFFQLGREPASAQRVLRALEGRSELPPALPENGETEAPSQDPLAEASAEVLPEPATVACSSYDEASVNYVLSLLQRRARLVDFAQQDIVSFDDEDVGAAARVVHEGLGQALQELGAIEPAVHGEEGQPYEVQADYDPRCLKLSGESLPEPPCRGILRHAGWRMRLAQLPSPLPEHDPTVLAQAEVEFGAV
jgi:hypothetical protein